eukprot:CAMPEP_0172439424 /NCGR_PEP_ID=MMETSP1065-20121228/421_1 /TAXON_ID=265537 /ORGANISM="Amphiprora paludosa, Strain CCMP125" /LENGTH=329 /DNA_ID=CAMNT_0013188105 /DNA_START=180 /DNA_END=1170 /DNA_ORIENTATION=-
MATKQAEDSPPPPQKVPSEPQLLEPTLIDTTVAAAEEEEQSASSPAVVVPPTESKPEGVTSLKKSSSGRSIGSTSSVKSQQGEETIDKQPRVGKVVSSSPDYNQHRQRPGILNAAEGGGSTKSVGSASGKPVAPPTTTASPLPTHLRVLVVDDDKILRKMVKQLLKRVEPTWVIKEAEDGETALEMTVANNTAASIPTSASSSSTPLKKFDLVFVDQYMSGSNEQKMLGTETVAEMRRRGVTCRLCGLSANSLELDFQKAGADAFLVKPFPSNKHVLINTLASIQKAAEEQPQALVARRHDTAASSKILQIHLSINSSNTILDSKASND